MVEATLECPKCRGGMATFERSGVQIDQCARCRGVFLDWGELERLIDAESEYLASLPADAEVPGGYEGRHRRGIIHHIFTGAKSA